MRALGIDSSTKTGFAVVSKMDGHAPTLLLEEEFAPKSTGLQRCSDIAERMLQIVEEFLPDVIAIEGLGFANAHTLVTLTEIHTILRYFLRQNDRPFLTVAPTQLKKFVTGSGASPKDKVMMALFKSWHFEAKTNNTADAIVLALIGLASRNALEDLTKVQREALKAFNSTQSKAA